MTKADLVDLDDKKVVDQLLDPFAGLIDAVAATKHIHGTLLPVACGPDPFNIALPVLWTLRLGILGRALALQETIENNYAQARQAAARDTLWDRFSSWLNDEPTWASISSSHLQKAREENLQYEQLIKPAEGLDDILKDVESF